MNLPISWLKELINIDCDLKELCDKITLSGSKVETVELQAHDITNVVIGKILKIEQHPDADKLVICQLDVGERTHQIVTGATNVFEGAFVPVALHGANLADGLKIKTGKLRGAASEGMLCSVEELGFGRHDYPEAPEDGIYIFKEEVAIGDNAVDVLKMKDEVIEFEITSNRPDCFSIYGLAREFAATFNAKLEPLDLSVNETATGEIKEMIKVSIQNPELCSRYVARVVKNIKIEPSPLWLRHKLTACGVRPINNIVDITNYVMLELGQPMHAFDLDLVHNSEIIVRTAKAGEVFTTLDGIDRNLDETMLVIADDEKAIGIAGIMGGENSKVSPDAHAILLESACFNGTNIRHSSKKLGLRTDASSKFEKNLDPNLALTAIDRACHLIELLGAGEVVKGNVDCYPNKREEWTVNYNPDNINKLLGTNIPKEEMERLLALLEIDAKDGIAKIKTFRPDLKLEADLAEEIARLYGYDKIESTLLTATPTVGKKSKKQIIEDVIKDTLVAQGLSEALNYSFESPKVFDKLNISENDDARKAVKISNPLGEDFSLMRTTTLNGMLNSLSTNYNRRNESAHLFEIANVYIPKSLPLEDLPLEIPTLTLGMYGADLDFYNIKGVIENLLERLGIKNVEFETEKELSYMHQGRTAKIFVNGTELGYIGEVHPAISASYEISAKVYIGVINVNVLIENTIFEKQFEPLPMFPSIKRDIALIVKDEVLVKEIEKIIFDKGGRYLKQVKLFDVYKGEQVGDGLKSVAYNLMFRADDKTLKTEDVAKNIEKILDSLEKELNAVLRK